MVGCSSIDWLSLLNGGGGISPFAATLRCCGGAPSVGWKCHRESRSRMAIASGVYEFAAMRKRQGRGLAVVRVREGFGSRGREPTQWLIC